VPTRAAILELSVSVKCPVTLASRAWLDKIEKVGKVGQGWARLGKVGQLTSMTCRTACTASMAQRTDGILRGTTRQRAHQG
jgi:hypothetical protein